MIMGKGDALVLKFIKGWCIGGADEIRSHPVPDNQNHVFPQTLGATTQHNKARQNYPENYSHRLASFLGQSNRSTQNLSVTRTLPKPLRVVWAIQTML
jgi:hypothetical protein